MVSDALMNCHQRLATLLHLPPSAELLSARVKYLQITVPADIYSSGIVCDVHGIDVHVKVLSEDRQMSDKNARRRSSRARGSAVHDNGGEHVLPKAADLAESFLEAEPEEEKEELEAAISSRSQVLKRGSSDVNDDDEELGLGDESLSLPGFLARFLKGIADRLQVTVKNISIRLDMEVGQDRTSKRQSESQPDLVSGLLTVGDVSSGAVSTATPSSMGTNTDEALSNKAGKRQVSLSDINIALVCDPVVFSKYSHFAAPESPSTTMQSKESPSLDRIRPFSPPPPDSSPSESPIAMSQSTIFRPPQDNERPQNVGSPRDSSISLGHNSSPSETESTDSQSSNEELANSRVYTHEEAQSMYMSATSHDPAGESFMPGMPGAWESMNLGGAAQRRSTSSAEPSQTARRRDEENDGASVSTPKLSAQQGPPFEMQSPEPTGATSNPYSPDSPVLNKATVAKRFFEIDKISVWLPPSDKGTTEVEESIVKSHSRQTNDDLKDSSAFNLGDSTIEGDLFESKIDDSSRVHNASMDSSRFTESVEPSVPRRQDGNKHHSNSYDKAADIDVEISSVAVHFDIATGYLLTKMGQRTLHAFNANGEGSSRGEPELPKGRQTRAAYNLALDKLSINFVERLPGYAFSLENTPSPSYPPTLEGVVLRVSSSGWKAHLFLEDNITRFRLDVSKFAFGFASEDMLSFDENLKVRESTRDIMSPVHADVSLSIFRSADAASVTMTTLPLHLNINIQRLEEAFSWLGGLSTIIEVGSSISSISTRKGGKTEPSSQQRPRGVRFEMGPPPSAEEPAQSGSTPWKVNARFGGLVVDVVGESHYVTLTTTAAKAVSRNEGVGLQIDRAKLAGPYVLDDAHNDTDNAAPVKVVLGNFRVEYLFSPKEADLDRLLALITPSQDKYDDDDDIMLDTLFRQRRQGAVLRVTTTAMKATVSRIDAIDSVSRLTSELSKLSTVAKYLPEDDRPGIMTLVLVRELDGHVHVGGEVGDLNMRFKNAEAAHVSIPSLIATRVGTMVVNRNGTEELLGEALPLGKGHDVDPLSPQPVLMARFVADEMDPTIKIKLYNLRAEYTISAMIAFLGLSNEVETGDVAAGMANSLANLADLQSSQQETDFLQRQSPESPEQANSSTKPTKLAVLLRNCLVGLNPRDTPAKGFAVLTNARFFGAIHEHGSPEATLDIRKASLMVVDDVKNVGYTDNMRRRGISASRSDQVQLLIEMGYVPVTTMSSAMAIVKFIPLDDDGTKSVDVELKDDLLILETCADSTQTLISILNGLQPPTPPSTTLKYRTEVMPIQDMLESFTGDAFATEPAPEPENAPDPSAEFEKVHGNEEALDDELDYVSDFHPTMPETEGEPLAQSMTGSGAGPSTGPSAGPSATGNLLDSFHSQYHVSSSVSELDFQEDHFSRQSAVGGTAHRWDSAYNTYGLANESKLRRSPLRVRVRDVHVIWNLFDGYDWQRTRDTISKVVKDVEVKATERRSRTANRASPSPDREEESVIGDFLFNSIYIGIPANRDPRELRQDINHEIDDVATETGSYATSTTVTGATARRASPHRRKKLRLSRSKHHKMTFELKGLSADFVVFPPGSGETQNSLDVRVNDLDIFDHVPTSTWKKFATYMREAGEKESGANMVHLEMLTVKPVPDLAASEIVLKVSQNLLIAGMVEIWSGSTNRKCLLCRLPFFPFDYMLTKMPLTS